MFLSKHITYDTRTSSVIGSLRSLHTVQKTFESPNLTGVLIGRMPFTTRQATAGDVPAIAKIFLSDETSSFLLLQLGTVDPAVLNGGMTDRLSESIQKPDQVYLIAQDDETGEIVSFAQWALPRDEMEEVVEQSPEVFHRRIVGFLLQC